MKVGCVVSYFVSRRKCNYSGQFGCGPSPLHLSQNALYTDEGGQTVGRKVDYPNPTQGSSNYSYNFGFLERKHSIRFNVLSDECTCAWCLCINLGL